MWGRLSYLSPRRSSSSLHSWAVILKDCPEQVRRPPAVKELHFRELRRRQKKKKKEFQTAWVTEHFSFFLLFLPETPRPSLSYANVLKKDTIVPGTVLKRREPYLKCPKPSISLSVQKTQLSWRWDAVTLSASHLVQVSSPSLTPSQFLSFIFSTTAFISFL